MMTRTEKARRLLRSGKLSYREIAIETGLHEAYVRVIKQRMLDPEYEREVRRDYYARAKVRKGRMAA